MSRSKKGSKGPGHEYWSKRPNSMSVPGKDSKKRTHRLERLEDKKLEKLTCCYGCPGDACEDVWECGCDCHFEGIGR